jgi:hypothetical protein
MVHLPYNYILSGTAEGHSSYCHSPIFLASTQTLASRNAAPVHSWSMSFLLDSKKSGPKQWGVDAPLSTAQPSEHDLRASAEVSRLLEEYKQIEPREKRLRRAAAWVKVNTLVHAWFREETQRMFPVGNEYVNDWDVMLFPFGSYSMGVHTPDGDIDTLCVGKYYTPQVVAC